MTPDRVRHPNPHAAAETDSSSGDERYRQLFRELLDGVALHEIVCDESGRPVDYRFLEVNPAFERLTGQRAADIVGKRALEVIPDLEPGWIERYGLVAETGIPAHFESYSAVLGRPFEVRSYRPAPGQFAAVFRDVSDRVRAHSDVVPGMSGREVATKLTAEQPDLRVLNMSGHTDKGIVHAGVLEPDIDFLAKPFTSAALLEAVNAVLAQAKGD